jgi:hypothetical protein
MQISGWVIFWPYIDAKGRYDAVFEAQPRSVPIGWFAAFQSVSAFSNTGMSLVDLSMIPFQKAYLMIYVRLTCGSVPLPATDAWYRLLQYLMLLILAGNTAYVRRLLSSHCCSTPRFLAYVNDLPRPFGNRSPSSSASSSGSYPASARSVLACMRRAASCSTTHGGATSICSLRTRRSSS